MTEARIEVESIVLPDLGLGPQDEDAVRKDVAAALEKALKDGFPPGVDPEQPFHRAVALVQARGGRPGQAGFAEAIAEAVVRAVMRRPGHG